MLIRCPECSVSFRVTAKQLPLAQGAVRCGNCEIVFNAVTTLSKDQRENTVGQTQGGYGSVESTEDSPSGMADPDSGNPSTISAENATMSWPAGAKRINRPARGKKSASDVFSMRPRTMMVRLCSSSKGKPQPRTSRKTTTFTGQTKSPTGKNTPNTAGIRFRNSIPLEQGKRQPQEYRAGRTWLQHRILGNTFKTP